jgi:hypothetical protein
MRDQELSSLVGRNNPVEHVSRKMPSPIFLHVLRRGVIGEETQVLASFQTVSVSKGAAVNLER